MIIDAHVHWWKKGFLMPDEFWPFFTVGLAQAYNVPCGIELSPEELERSFLDPDGSALLQRMDNAGIDKSVLLPLDLAIVNQQEAPMDILAINREYAELAQANPDRLISFFSMDPRRDNVERHFLTAVQEWGMKGLKLYPPTGFFPGDDCCAALYRICLDRNLPVTFHCAIAAMSPQDHGHPGNYRAALEKFPGLKIILAHAGGSDVLNPEVCKFVPGQAEASLWFDLALNLAADFDSVYLDISAWEVYDDQKISEYLQRVISKLGSLDRVLFGTDYPIFFGMNSSQKWVKRIQATNIPENEKANLLGGNAARLLGLVD
ncbi:MAG: amidohydrolase family protein [Syntrophomonadaceae bacterium]|nr:amidohydrolase family protein [Syntrophomonadaceae bacterium]